MDGGRAEAFEGGEMLASAIAFVSFEIRTGKVAIPMVSIILSRVTLAITEAAAMCALLASPSHDMCLRVGPFRNSKSVDEHMRRDDDEVA